MKHPCRAGLFSLLFLPIISFSAHATTTVAYTIPETDLTITKGDTYSLTATLNVPPPAPPPPNTPPPSTPTPPPPTQVLPYFYLLIPTTTTARNVTVQLSPSSSPLVYAEIFLPRSNGYTVSNFHDTFNTYTSNSGDTSANGDNSPVTFTIPANTGGLALAIRGNFHSNASLINTNTGKLNTPPQNIPFNFQVTVQ